jgi:single-strand DNA-binding protein
MAQDMNQVALVGRLTRDPELRGQGGNVLAMRLAFSASRKNGDQWEDYPQYVDVVTFGRTAEALGSLLTKGDQVGITGRLSWREWEQQDGTKRQAHEVIADRVQLLGKPRGAQDSPSAATTAPVAAPAASNDEDIPF